MKPPNANEAHTESTSSEPSERSRADIRLLAPAVFAWATCAAALETQPLVWAIVITTLGAAAVLLLARRGSRFASSTALATVLAGTVLVAAAAQTGMDRAGPIPELAAAGESVTLRGRVLGDPRLVPPNDQRPLPLVIVRVHVHEVEAFREGSRTRANVSTPVVVFADTDALALSWGDSVMLRGRLASTQNGDSEVATVRPSGHITRERQAGPWLTAAEKARHVLRRATENLPADAAGLVPAMVVGDVSRLPDQLADAMKATNLTHLSAVSGTNVTYVLLGVIALARLLGVPRLVRVLMCLLALAAFVVVARPDPSVVRAAVMGAIGLLGVLLSRRGSGLPALAGAMMVLLLVDPYLSRSYGFALSVLATAGILLFARPWGESIADWLPDRCRPLAFAVSVPLAAQVTCTPVLVLLQPSVPIVGVLANLLAGPLVAPVTLGGIGAGFVGAWWMEFAHVLAWVPGVCALGIAQVARLLALVPGGTLPWPGGPPGALLLAVLTVTLLLSGPLLSRIVGRLGRATILLPLVALTAWAAWVIPWPWLRGDAEEWQLAACDVGQGDALVLATGTPGQAVLVDAGRDPALVDRCLSRLGVTDLVAVVLTHFDGDHVDGLSGALQGRSVGTMVVSAAADPAKLPSATQSSSTGASADVQAWRAGDSAVWGDLELRALSPESAHMSSANDGSLVLMARAGELRALLLADVEEDASAAVARMVTGRQQDAPGLAAASGDTHIDVVKVSHHGSASVSPQLYSRLRARIALISVGADNSYGHPAPSVLSDLAAAGTPVWRTDEKGTVTVRTDHHGGRRVLTVNSLATR